MLLFASLVFGVGCGVRRLDSDPVHTFLVSRGQLRSLFTQPKKIRKRYEIEES